MKSVRLMTLAPGHFHAALVQKRAHPAVAARSYVYGPLDADTVAHVDRVAAFNSRPDDPTAWEIDLRAGANWLDWFTQEQPGNTVVLSGRNRPKIDLMRTAASHGLHVLADKPWVIEPADFPKLEALFREADLREVLVWDVMTERHEVTNRLQRELVRDVDVFGDWQPGTARHPALRLESVHHLKKTVAGRPLVRPWWWFDAGVSGEAMADVGTHLADLALWLVAPDRAVNYRSEVEFLGAEGWPLVLAEEQFHALTGLTEHPPELSSRVVNGQLYYAGNNTAALVLCGVHVGLRTLWEYEAPPGGGDTHASVAYGTRAKVEVRQQPGGRRLRRRHGRRQSAPAHGLAVRAARQARWQRQRRPAHRGRTRHADDELAIDRARQGRRQRSGHRRQHGALPARVSFGGLGRQRQRS